MLRDRSRPVASRWGAARRSSNVAAQGFAAIKSRLAGGQDATVWVNADSTGYSDYGPFYKLFTAIGDIHDATVNLYRWSEWTVSDTSVGTGPKEFPASPTVLRSGPGPTLTVYLAALPGSSTLAMFDDSRRTNAVDGVPTPHLVMHHHGHNLQSFSQAIDATHYESGVGLFLSAMGMVSSKWGALAQIVTSQNPWRDNALYDKVYNAILTLGQIYPTVGIIDTHAAFVAASKSSTLYRDNIHPSDTSGNSAGAQLAADTMYSVYLAAGTSNALSTLDWTTRGGSSLIVNWDFTPWTGTNPSGWGVSNATFTKDTGNTVGGKSWSAVIAPTSLVTQGQFQNAFHNFTTADKNAVASKTISLAALVDIDGAQTLPCFLSLNIRVVKSDGSNGVVGFAASTRQISSFTAGRVWLTLPNLRVPAGVVSDSPFVAVTPAFGGSAPTSLASVRVHRVCIVEGAYPSGLL